MTTLLIASRYLLGRKLRTFLTTLAVVFGVFVIFGMNILVPTLMEAFTANVRAASDQVDITISDSTGESFSTKVLDRVARIEGVKVAAGFLKRTINLPADYFDRDSSAPDVFSTLELVGVNPDIEELHAYTILEGRFLRRTDLASAVITTTLADGVGVGLGDVLTIPTARGKTKLTIIGLMSPRTAPGGEQILVTLAEAQYLVNQPGKINTIEANFIPTDSAERDLVSQDIEAMLGEDYQIGTLASGSALLSNIQLGQILFSMFGFLALLMGGFIIFNTFRTIVAERRHDIGMLRAIGASRGRILTLILAEGLVQGIVGTGVGMMLGYLMGRVVVGLLGPMMEQFVHIKLGTPVVPLWLVMITLSAGIGVTLLAGLIPAYNASRVTPLEALRPSSNEAAGQRAITVSVGLGGVLILLAIIGLLSNDIRYAGMGVFGFLLGLILVAPVLLVPIARVFNLMVMWIFARDGTSTLAEANLTRQPSRAAITASATMIGLAVIVALIGMTRSIRVGFLDVIRKSLGSDYLLLPPAVGLWEGNLGSSNELADRLRNVHGVGVVSTLRPALTEAEGIAASVLGIDPEDYPLVAGLNFDEGYGELAYAQLGEGRNVIVNGVLASKIETNLGSAHIGDPIRLTTPTGQREYIIVGVAGDYFNAKLPSLYISQAYLKKDFGKDEDVFIQLNLTPDADPAQVQPDIAEIVAEYPQFKLVSGRDYYEENRKLFDAAFMAYDVLMAILAGPSLIALVNTLAIAVIERTREIGMLRATGATRNQVGRMILIEAVLLAAVGTLFGILAGLYLGYVLVGLMSWSGFPVTYVFPSQGIAIAIIVGLVFGAIAAIIPARQAAKLEIVQALQYE